MHYNLMFRWLQDSYNQNLSTLWSNDCVDLARIHDLPSPYLITIQIPLEQILVLNSIKNLDFFNVVEEDLC